MTQAAAFRATYSDFKLIKTRGVVSISFEVPLEQVDLAYQVLGGMPDISAERWFAVARLGGETSMAPPVEAAGPCGETLDRPHKPRKPVASDKRLAQQAGILCADPVFQQFLLERCCIETKCEIESAAFVRDYCAITSRAELIPGEPCAMLWLKLHGEFEAWKLAA